MKLASFDIFDTTLIRKCGEPEIIFQLLAKQLFPNDKDLQIAFTIWRKQAEANIKENNHEKEITLKNIYSNIDISFVSSYTPEQLINAELKIESENLTANLEVLSLIKQKREDGYHIVFISDMYLNSQFLHNILIREKCAQKEDIIYVSCEWNARKSTGELYEKVKEQLKPDIWIHFGDNKWSDIKQAERKGIKATLIHTEFTSTELTLQKISVPDINTLIGLSRWYRLTKGNNSSNKLAADFVVPAYLPYVFFVLTEAQKRGIKRLYFLSRDGYALIKAAQAMRHKFPNIELKYLFVSRRALLLPYLRNEGKEAYLKALTTIKSSSVDKQLEHLGTNREELKCQYGITFDYSEIKEQRQQEDFLEKIFNSNFTKALQEKSTQQEILLMQYFKQEGLLDGEEYAGVDVGWVGTSRMMINHILRKHGHKDLHMFYYGLRDDVFPPSSGKYTSYLNIDQALINATVVIENFYSASPYPSTIGYIRETSGHITPIFPKGEIYQENLIVQTNINALETIGKEIALISSINPLSLMIWSQNSTKLILQNNIKIDFSPLLQCQKFDGTPFVKRLTLSELIKIMIFNRKITKIDFISLKISLPHFLYQAYIQTRRLAKKVKNVLWNTDSYHK